MECIHTTVIHDMCADCGADLRQNEKVIFALYRMYEAQYYIIVIL